jgi:hypothetical protein
MHGRWNTTDVKIKKEGVMGDINLEAHGMMGEKSPI